MCLRAATANEEHRTVEAVLATENPVEMVDLRGSPIDEVLLADGAEMPSQMPLLSVHSRWSLDDVLGSVRGIRREGGDIVGTLHFADDERSQKAWAKVRDGHLTDLSVGYRVAKEVNIRPGESKTVSGRVYTAGTKTLRIALRWIPKEASLVPIGADEKAKVREDGMDEPRSEGSATSLQVIDDDRTPAARCSRAGMAVHEAAHAVIAKVLGMNPRAVMLNSTGIDRVRGMVWHEAQGEINPDNIRALMVSSAAGYVAQAIQEPTSRIAEGNSDQLEVERLARVLVGVRAGESVFREAVATAWNEAEIMVRKYADEIAAVADELIRFDDLIQSIQC